MRRFNNNRGGCALKAWAAALAAALTFGASQGIAQLRAVNLSAADRPTLVHIVVSAEGLRPASIARVEGPFYLMIENRSRISQINVSLSRGGSPQELLRSQHQPTQADTLQLIDLAPGEYTFTVVEVPKWQMRIVVKPK
jgi:hypothetical protein